MGQVISFIFGRLFGAKKTIEDRKPKSTELYSPLHSYYIDINEEEHNLNEASSFDSFHQQHHVVPITPPPQQQEEAMLDPLEEADLHQPLIARSATNWVEFESASIAACVKETKEVILEAVAEEATSSKTKRKKKKNKKKCPKKDEEIVRKIGPFKSKHKILLVGEGDFSFSASLAIAFGHASNIVTTSLDNKAFLQKNYKMAMSNIMELENRSSSVIHGVDATKVSKHTSLKGMKFDRIIFNFPHTCSFGRSTSDISRNQKLVLGFLRNGKQMIEEDGEIHVTHKTSRTYSKWNIVQLGLMEGLFLIEECPFNPRVYSGYNTKYGHGGDNNFDCLPCKTYKFGLVCSA